MGCSNSKENKADAQNKDAFTPIVSEKGRIQPPKSASHKSTPDEKPSAPVMGSAPV